MNMDPAVYDSGLTVMSIIIVLFGGWLVTMMVARMAARREWAGEDVAALTYVLSSVLVFFVIAGRKVWMWPTDFTFGIIFLKMVSVIAVSIWFRFGRSAP